MEFDVEPTKNLYLSITDRIITGSLFAGTRGLVGSKISGSLEYRGDQVYSSYYYNKFKRTNLGSNRHVSFVSQDKIIWDSVVPSPMEIYLMNGGKVVSSEYDTSIWNNFWGPAPPDKIRLREFLVKIFIAKGSNSFLTASNGASITDNYWYSSFPFQNTYRNISRLFQPSTTLHFTNGYKEKINGTDLLVYQKGATGDVSASFKFGISFISGNNGSLSSSFIQEVLYEYTITPSVFTVLEAGNSADFQSILNLSSKTFYECFFGIRPRMVQTDLSYINTSSFPQCQYSQSFVAEKEGWKFGLYNAFPTNYNVVFKRDSYGQIRDLLEPRKRTKTYELSTGTFLTPIQITFVSGTQAYLTSSEADTLDTRETGIYNFEYQCGKPYVDN